MSILEEIKQGFDTEFRSAAPDAAIELQHEGHEGTWHARRQHMTQSFMRVYGNTLVASAVVGLNNERMALMVAQEFNILMTMDITGGGTAFENYVKTALRNLFNLTMQDVIVTRLNEWWEHVTAEAEVAR